MLLGDIMVREHTFGHTELKLVMELEKEEKDVFGADARIKF